MPSHQTGLLIIRAWVEADSDKPLRAHVRLTSDLSHGIERTFTVADAHEIHGLVETWLGDVLCAAARDDAHDAGAEIV